MRRGPPAVRRSSLYVPVEKSPPAHAQIASHRLMIQAGLMRQTAAGIYSLLPLGLRSLDKLSRIVDHEMQAIGAQKLVMPSLLPTSLWKQSGRWKNAGDEVLKLNDRKGESFMLAPTHEEVVTDLVAHTVRSYRALPLRLYQIGVKFRDEARPRSGLIRGREFIMKDMYSFDVNQEAAFQSYDTVLAAYRRLFSTLRIPYVIAEADAGSIGGSRTHEFHALTPVGEDLLLSCSACGYTANVEKAKGKLTASPVSTSSNASFSPSAADAWAALRSHLSVISVLATGSERLLGYVVLRSGQEANQVAIKDLFSWEFLLRPVDLLRASPASPAKGLRVLIDESIQTLSPDSARTVAAWGTADGGEVTNGVFRNAQAGDGCPKCEEGKLSSQKGIELGHVFYLGTKYSAPMKAVMLHNGQNKPIEMGCYGLGMTRIISSVIETSNDEHGIVWPSVLAPYKAVVLTFSRDAPATLEEEAQAIASQLTALPGFEGEVVYDDRAELQPGAKMREAQVLGYPWMLILGRKWLTEHLVEIEERKGGKKLYLKRSELPKYFEEATQRL